MAALIIDIETVGEDYESLDETTKEVMTRWIRKESSSDEEFRVALDDLKEGLGFSPLTGRIVALGILDAEKEKGAVYYETPDLGAVESEEGAFKLRAMSEKEMLELFWKLALRYNEFVTFNGRGFDIPFMLVRSAVHGVRPTRNLMSNRYLSSQFESAQHIDLQDLLTFYGAVRKKGSLHMWCRAFGIESPKAEGVTGDDVGRLYKEGKYLDIARYNTRDLIATKKLYDVWKSYLRF